MQNPVEFVWPTPRFERSTILKVGRPTLLGSHPSFAMFTAGRPRQASDIFRVYTFAGSIVRLLDNNALARLHGPAFLTMMMMPFMNIGAGEFEFQCSPLQSDLRNVDGETLFYAVNPIAQNTYGHWLVDYLPTMIAIRDLIGGCKLKILYKGYLAPHGPEISSVFGFEKEDFVSVESFKPGDEIFVALASRVRQSDYFNEDVFQSHVAPLVEKVCRDLPKRSGRKVFVSKALARNGHNSGALINRQEVEDLFRSSGYEIVLSEQLSAQEKIGLYGSTSILAGEAGSGLHHSIFMRPGSHVVVLNSGHQHHLIQASLCETLGQSCTMVIGQEEHQDWHSNFAVDLSEVEKAISQADDTIFNV